MSIWQIFSPEMVSKLAPGPVMVVSAVIVGREPVSLIVPRAAVAKFTVLPGVPFAAVIASRSEQTVVVQEPLFESTFVVTRKVAALDAAGARKLNATQARATDIEDNTFVRKNQAEVVQNIRKPRNLPRAGDLKLNKL